MLVASVLFCIGAGYVTAAIAPGVGYWPVLVLCGIQLALGLIFQTQAWKRMPVWYHLSFLLLLAPATLLGA